VSRRTRAGGVGAAALLCAALAAAAVGSYGDSAKQGYGDLQPVLVTRSPLPAHKPIERPALARSFEVRRVPADFVPPDALDDPSQALGGRPAATLVAGSYVTQAMLVSTSSPAPRPRGPLAGARSPVELTVTGGAALASIASRAGERVDVVVTTEPGPGPRRGRTYVAAERVPLLEIRRDDDAGAVAGEGGSIATLALRRPQALELIRAESFARSIRLLAA
jgi:Flp pilus assembly protein CpaB